MGLLTQAIAGGLSQGADTYAGMMVDKVKTDHAAAIMSERDKAQALRDQSLAEFRQNLHDTSEKAKEQRLAETTFEPDLRTPGGQPVTKAEAVKLNKTGSLINAKDEAAAAKAEAAAAKTQSTIEIAEIKAESKAKELDATQRLIEAKIERLQALNAKGSDDTLKELLFELKKTEQERKSLEDANKLKAEGDLNDPDTKAAYDKLMKDAGVGVAPVKKEETPVKGKGLISSIGEGIKSVFSDKPAEAGNTNATRQTHTQQNDPKAIFGRKPEAKRKPLSAFQK